MSNAHCQDKTVFSWVSFKRWSRLECLERTTTCGRVMRWKKSIYFEFVKQLKAAQWEQLNQNDIFVLKWEKYQYSAYPDYSGSFTRFNILLINKHWKLHHLQTFEPEKWVDSRNKHTGCSILIKTCHKCEKVCFINNIDCTSFLILKIKIKKEFPDMSLP